MSPIRSIADGIERLAQRARRHARSSGDREWRAAGGSAEERRRPDRARHAGRSRRCWPRPSGSASSAGMAWATTWSTCRRLTKRGIALMITPEANAASVAEHALMLMLNLARNVVPVSAAVRRGEWRVRGQSSTFELGGRKVLRGGLRPHRHPRRPAVQRLRHAGHGPRSLPARRHDRAARDMKPSRTAMRASSAGGHRDPARSRQRDRRAAW